MSDPSQPLPDVMACGFLVFRRQPRVSFLLMRHPDRLDLPKGHVDPGETERQCALRELEEETGITAADLEIDPSFRFQTQYRVRYKRRFGGGVANKTLVIFLGWLRSPVEIAPTEHLDFHWQDWAPPHRLQAQTIDPLLAQAELHFGETLPSSGGNHDGDTTK